MFRVRVYDEAGSQVSAVPFDNFEAVIDYSIMAREGEFHVGVDIAMPPTMIDLAQLTTEQAMQLIVVLTAAVTDALADQEE